MNTISKCVSICVFAFSTALAWALDNTINNDFWDTRAYENPSPDVQTATTDVGFEFCVPFVVVSDILVVLDTSPLGLTIMVR